MFERAFKMREGDIFSHYQSFHLEELGFVRHVGCFVAKDVARYDDAIWRLYAFLNLLFHVAHLDRASVRAQAPCPARLYIKKVSCMSRAGWSFGTLSMSKLYHSSSTSGPSAKRKAHIKKDTICLADEA